MQQFIVPQFIDVEDKIIGPITTRQFMIMIVGGIGISIAYKSTDLKGFIISAVIILALVIVFAFVKINGQLFHMFIVNLLETLKRPGLRVWDKTLGKGALKRKIGHEEKKEAETVVRKKPYLKSRLTELSLVIDTGGVYQGEEPE